MRGRRINTLYQDDLGEEKRKRKEEKRKQEQEKKEASLRAKREAKQAQERKKREAKQGKKGSGPRTGTHMNFDRSDRTHSFRGKIPNIIEETVSYLEKDGTLMPLLNFPSFSHALHTLQID